MKLIMVSMVTGSDELGVESTTPTVMNADYVRSFYPRRENKDGTRITFDDGGGWGITEGYEEIKAKMAAAGIAFVELTEARDAPAQIDEDTGEVVNAHDERLAPMSVRPDLIRCFYPRKDGKVGTRLTFNKTAGIAVHEMFERVAALCGATASRPALPAPAGN